jgi:hypothetical protein
VFFDPASGSATPIGTYVCMSPGEFMLDIAVDSTQTIYGATYSRLVRINAATGACSTLAWVPGSIFPNSLAFVAAGTVSPNQETLVGYARNDQGLSVRYVKVDLATGAMTELGNLNGADAGVLYQASGDLISLAQNGNRTYVTIQSLSGNPAQGDLLAEVDPRTGTIIRTVGDTTYPGLYGLAYYRGKAFGFSANGSVVSIDLATAQSTFVSLLGDGGAEFTGAGTSPQTQ